MSTIDFIARAMAMQVRTAAGITSLVTGTGSASSNTTLIQAALNAGGEVFLAGSGTVYINNTLTIYSNTHLTVSPNLTIKQAASTLKPMLRTAAYSTATASVTVSWTAARACPVAWTAHGLAVGDYIWLDGAVEGPFRGVFRVAVVTDANNIILTLRRTPTANATGTTVAKLANVNIIVEGGTWDYDQVNNQTSTATDKHALIFAGVYNVQVRDLTIKNALKFCVLFAAISKYKLEGLNVPVTNSDVVKIYGPAFDGEVDDAHSIGGDDFVTLQPREADAFSAYRFTYGDIIGFRGRRLHCEAQGAFRIFGIYASQNFICDDVFVEGITGNTAGYAAVIQESTAETSTVIGSVEIRGVEAYATLNQVRLSAATFEKAIINISDGRSATNLIEVTSTATVKHLIIDRPRLNDTTFGASGAQVICLINGAVTKIDMVEPNVVAGSSARGIQYGGTSKVLDNINVKGGVVSNGDGLVVLASGSTTTNVPKVVIDGVKTSTTSVLNSSIAVQGVVLNCDISSATNGVLRAAGTSTAMRIAGNGNILRSGSWIVVPSGTPLISIDSTDFQVAIDATYVVRATGLLAYNTNAAAGTLGVAGIVDCLGTAASSWHLRTDPTKVY